MLKLGLIGAGRIGVVHGRTVTNSIADAEITAIADTNIAAAKALAGELGVGRCCETATELLDDDALDAVLICSSTDTHADLVMEAAARRKHIFCEKPLDLDLVRIDAALDAVGEAGVKLQMGFNRRFDPDFAACRTLVESGEVGEVHLLRITSRDPGPPPLTYIKVSGGLFLDMTVHDFDMARFIVGAEVTEVFAAAGVLVDPAIGEAGDVDTAVVTMRFDNGALCTIDNSRRASYGYDQRLEVFGSKAMARCGNRHENHLVLASERGYLATPLENFFMQRYREAYALQLESFVGCLKDDRAPVVDGEDGRKAILLGYAAKRSVEIGAPVKLEGFAP